MAAPVRLPCILFALERERLAIHDRLQIEQKIHDAPCSSFLCTHDERRTLIVETGVGAACTLRALNWLFGRPRVNDEYFEPTLVLFAGFAGALDPSVSVGDLIMAHHIVDLHGNMWTTTWQHPAWLGSVVSAADVSWRCGTLLTSNRFIGDPLEKLALGRKHQALAVDMESAMFARRCSVARVPWASLRVVSDDVFVPFTVEIAELVESGRVKMGRVCSLLARKPWLLPKLVRLAGQTRRAARRLADGVVQFLACSSNG